MSTTARAVAAAPAHAPQERPTVDELLTAARARTLALVDLPDDVQRAQISPLMSPLVWDLAHIANYEELWLLRAIDGREPIDAALDDLYNAFEHPRWARPDLPILGPVEARAYAEHVRAEVLALLASLDEEREEALLAGGFVFGMVIQHEHQHCETLLATLQLLGEQAPAVPRMDAPASGPSGVARATPSARRATPNRGSDRDMVRVPGGQVTIGTMDDPWAYDNERPAHTVDVAPFWLDRTPVTTSAYRGFVEAGGYDDAAWWSPSGWAWREQADLSAPQFWSDDLTRVLRFGTWRSIDPDEPVQHVCFHEAQAYARWAGARLPTEAEWEHAATTGPDGTKRRFPWGDDLPTARHANLGQRHDGPLPVDALPDGANPWGILGLIGDVWEWTSSPFEPYPGFVSFPYREYSEVFFGAGEGDDGHRVLRGGSWAADPVAVRGTFRNWDHPIRRQIFSGFRCARDIVEDRG